MTPARALRAWAVRVLAGILLAITTPFSLAQTSADESAARGKEEKKGAKAHARAAEGDKSAKAAKASKDEKKDAKAKAARGDKKDAKGTVLTVLVTGDGKPVGQARVKVQPLAKSRNEVTLFTNSAGEAIFNFAASGKARVRVIAAGWESAQREVALEQGPQELALALKALPNNK